jgi:hypothetical protein
VAQQGSPPHRFGRSSASTRREARSPGGYSWDDAGPETDEEYPPWAGPGITPRWADQEERDRRRRGRPGQAPRHQDVGQPDGSELDSGYGQHEAGQWDGTTPAASPESAPAPGRGGGHRPRPGFRSRLAEARARRNRLMLFIWGGAAVVVAVIAVVVVMHLGGHPAPKPVSDGLVTTFQHGEMKTVPKACAAVNTATLTQYLPGHRTSIAPRSLDGKAQSLCDWTVDAPPVYRQLNLTVQAYAPSGLATGNGSATQAATDAYATARQQKIQPPRATHMPKATVSQISGLGSQAFAALQVVTAGGDTTDIMTVVVRDHNVLVTVILQGLDKSHSGKYGPVVTPQLRGGAIATARDVLSQLH